MTANRFRFRYWWPKSGEKGGAMVYPAAWDNDLLLDMEQGALYEVCGPDGATWTKYHPECVLMQSTGLEDKNGKEIFEGDILARRGGEISLVQWANNNVNLADVLELSGWIIQRTGVAGCPDLPPSHNRPLPLTSRRAGKAEVVGNFCENPELLKEKP